MKRDPCFGALNSAISSLTVCGFLRQVGVNGAFSHNPPPKQVGSRRLPAMPLLLHAGVCDSSGHWEPVPIALQYDMSSHRKLARVWGAVFGGNAAGTIPLDPYAAAMTPGLDRHAHALQGAGA